MLRDGSRDAGGDGSLERHWQGRAGSTSRLPIAATVIESACAKDSGRAEAVAGPQQHVAQAPLTQQSRVPLAAVLATVEAVASAGANSAPVIAVTIAIARSRKCRRQLTIVAIRKIAQIITPQQL
jgi:hypothetical protein